MVALVAFPLNAACSGDKSVVALRFLEGAFGALNFGTTALCSMNSFITAFRSSGVEACCILALISWAFALHSSTFLLCSLIAAALFCLCSAILDSYSLSPSSYFDLSLPAIAADLGPCFVSTFMPRVRRSNLPAILLASFSLSCFLLTSRSLVLLPS